MPTKRKPSKKTRVTKAKRRQPKILSHTLYTYVKPANGKHAQVFGKKKFGSVSKYIDAIITIDRAKHFSTKTFATPTKKRTKKTTGKKVIRIRAKTKPSVSVETQAAA